MTSPVDMLDLSALHLEPGGGRRLELELAIEPFDLGGEEYAVGPSRVPARVDVSRMTGGGYALRLRFEVTLTGPCMRCLEPAAPEIAVDVREVSGQPDAGDELDWPYLDGGELALGAWARDALALALPAVLLCRADCAGLCPVCGIDLNAAGPDHGHPTEPDPRWEKLSELRLD